MHPVVTVSTIARTSPCSPGITKSGALGYGTAFPTTSAPRTRRVHCDRGVPCGEFHCGRDYQWLEKERPHGARICGTDTMDAVVYSVATSRSRPRAESSENGVNGSCGDANWTRLSNGRYQRPIVSRSPNWSAAAGVQLEERVGSRRRWSMGVIESNADRCYVLHPGRCY